MKNIYNVLVALSIVLFVGTLFVAMPAPMAMAFGESEDGGCCGGSNDNGGTTGGTTSNSDDDDNEPTPVIPTCVISASPSSVTTGGRTTLTWTTRNAVSATLNQGIGSVAVGASRTRAVTVDSTKTYTMTVRSASGHNATCAARVTVTTPTIPAPACDLNAAPATIATGGSTRLTWTTQNAVSATLNQGIGAVDPRNTTGRSVSPLATKTYTMTVTNSAGVSKTCAATVTVNVVTVPAPACDLTATPTTINRGGNSQLTWTTQNAVSATINQGIGAVDPRNTTGRSVSPTDTTTYTMTVTNSAGVSRTCVAAVTIKDTPVVPAPVCDLNAAPTTISRGDSSTLTWTTQNAVSATINQGIGAVALQNTAGRSISPTDTTTYTMTVTNSAGVSKTCAATVTIKGTPTIPAPACDLNAAPTTISRGDSSTLTWTTQNAVSATINQGIGAVDPKDTTDYRTVKPTKTITYTMTVTNSAGVSKSCDATVTVKETPTPLSCAANVDFYATRTTIDEGEDSTLIWNTTGITSLSISGISSTALDGSAVVSPRSDTTYTMSASNGTDTISCPVRIEVDEDNGGGGGGGGSSTPRCDLDLSDTKIRRGDRVTLTWNTSNATEVTVKDNHGKTLVSTEDLLSSKKRDLYDGDMTLRPERDTTYTLIAERGSKDRTCTIKVDVEDPLTVITDRDQKPVVGGIDLGDVPYTGFEAGPFLTMLFYGVLVLWALYLAYLLVIRRNSIGGVALAPVTVVPATPSAIPAFVAPVAATTAAAATPVVGYSTAPRDTTYDAVAGEIENRAHLARVLLSSEAMRHLVNETTADTRFAAIEAAFKQAKASYPAEDGWVVVNEERAKALLAPATPVVVSAFTPAAVVTPMPTTAGNSSLAEAIVTGNIVAAYQMIGHRPMIALADAAAELDMLLRAKRGDVVAVSALLGAAPLTLPQLEGAIAALTGALDGTYTDEGAAVKMAIMKAVKAIHG